MSVLDEACLLDRNFQWLVYSCTDGGSTTDLTFFVWICVVRTSGVALLHAQPGTLHSIAVFDSES